MDRTLAGDGGQGSRVALALADVERQRRTAASIAPVLLIALLPMFTFFGHWEIRFDLPGTRYYFSWPTDSRGGHGDPADQHEHAGHCHGEVASCTNSAATAVAAVALLGRELLIDIDATPPVALPSDAWQPSAVCTVAPEPPPPRRA